MPRISFANGILTHQCDDWIDFGDFITERLERSPIVWRGQKDADWKLEPTLARVARRMAAKKTPLSKYPVDRHLDTFRYATRGRRGPSPRQIPKDETMEWWALGQHHGLATQLLDWTHSPYVAAFFAYAEETAPMNDLRAIYGLFESSVTKKSSELLTNWDQQKKQLESKGDRSAINKLGFAEVVTFYRPLTDENQRLISQNGLFTKCPFRIDLEGWVQKHFAGEEKAPKLYKLLLPETERLTALRSLNRMNINYLTLFPDLVGASLHSNMSFEIDHY